MRTREDIEKELAGYYSAAHYYKDDKQQQQVLAQKEQEVLREILLEIRDLLNK
jgi:hypothetical protein